MIVSCLSRNKTDGGYGDMVKYLLMDEAGGYKIGIRVGGERIMQRQAYAINDAV